MLNEKAKEFIKQMLPVSKAQGFNPYSILAHAWDESGAFGHVIGKNNYWGIKTPQKSVWKGSVAEVWTHEDELIIGNETPDQAIERLIKKYGVSKGRIDGTIKNKEKTYWHFGLPLFFRDWTTCEAALSWYCDFVKQVYPKAFENRSNPDLYFEGLKGWATNPNYINDLKQLNKILLRDYPNLSAI